MSLSKIEKERLEKGIKAKQLFDEVMHLRVVNSNPVKEIPILNKVIALDPEAYWAYAAKVVLLNTIAKPESKDYAKLTMEAKACIEEAFRINPNSPQVVFTKWKMEHKDASKAETETAMRHVLELPAVTFRDYMTHARAYKALGRNELEIEKYKSILQIPEYSQNFEVWYNLAYWLYEAKRFTESAVAYEHVTTSDPKYANGWSGLGLSLMKVGRNLEAEVALRKALKFSPKNTDDLQNLANALSSQGKYEESMAIHQKMLKIDSSNADAHHGLSSDITNIAGRNLVSKPKAYLKALEKALVESNKALAQDPDNVLYLAGKAEVLVGLKRSGEALDTILNAEELLKHMSSAEKADLHAVLPFIEDVLAHKAALVVDLKLTDQALQDMVEAIVGLHDSGTEDHDGLAGVNSSLDSGDSDQSS